MFTERLLLEVQASKLGLNAMKPPLVKGRSGTVHSFSFLASSEKVLYGFDAYERVSEIEVLKSYVKAYDTGVALAIVSLEGAVTDSARQLLREYKMAVLNESEIPGYFDKLLLKKDADPSGMLSVTS